MSQNCHESICLGTEIPEPCPHFQVYLAVQLYDTAEHATPQGRICCKFEGSSGHSTSVDGWSPVRPNSRSKASALFLRCQNSAVAVANLLHQMDRVHWLESNLLVWLQKVLLQTAKRSTRAVIRQTVRKSKCSCEISVLLLIISPLRSITSKCSHSSICAWICHAQVSVFSIIHPSFWLWYLR